ncbi:Prenylcysteine oxidase [Trichodelitschia bisporula]|uniref:Prenylcysteine oxidase n=1 Tax=Trichodelitschia bisporula TaxID=703511 RepID=A0A6G1HVK7_9PEZI|nr:Prenylcysteine oxidase [Trichodelitschia bisporula]
MRLSHIPVLALAAVPSFAVHTHGHSHSGHEKTVMSAKRVAIIGAGAAGSSAAYHLRKDAAAAGIPVNITIYERAPYIGGRSTTVNAYDDASEPVELGASIFVKVNRILVNASEEFNLSTGAMVSARPKTQAGALLGIWNGEKFLYTQGAGAGAGWWWDLARLVWRYGLAPIRTNNLMKDVVGRFLKMYEEPYFPFASLTQVAYELGLTAVTAATGEEYLRENGIGDLFAQEIIQASTRVNYAQNLPLIHGLETMVCMATDGAVSVQGGNWQIFDRMAKAGANSIHLSSNVTSLQRQPDGTYILSAKPIHPSTAAATTSTYDTVILAAPYQFSDISFNPLPQHIPDPIPYVNLHVTLFASPHPLAPAAFNLAPGAEVPQIVLTTLLPTEHPGTTPVYPGKAGFFSISQLRPVTNPATSKGEFLYKIFSPERVEVAFLGRILGVEHSGDAENLDKGDVSWIYRKLWQSYPYEYPRVTFPELRLEDGLWYTSGMESFISTMETSALSGMNVARLVVDEWISRGKGVVEGGERVRGPGEGRQQVLKSKL